MAYRTQYIDALSAGTEQVTEVQSVEGQAGKVGSVLFRDDCNLGCTENREENSWRVPSQMIFIHRYTR